MYIYILEFLIVRLNSIELCAFIANWQKLNRFVNDFSRWLFSFTTSHTIVKYVFWFSFSIVLLPSHYLQKIHTQTERDINCQKPFHLHVCLCIASRQFDSVSFLVRLLHAWVVLLLSVAFIINDRACVCALVYIAPSDTSIIRLTTCIFVREHIGYKITISLSKRLILKCHFVFVAVFWLQWSAFIRCT